MNYTFTGIIQYNNKVSRVMSALILVILNFLKFLNSSNLFPTVILGSGNQIVLVDYFFEPFR